MNRLLGQIALVLLVIATGCSSDPTTPPTGNVNVLLTDAPLDLSGVTAVNVTLEEIILFGSDDTEATGGTEMPLLDPTGEEIVVNLLDYQNGKTVPVASMETAADEYHRIRLLISAAELVTDDDDDPETPDLVEPIFISSGKVDIPVAFTVSGGETVDVTLDFDAALSVQVNSTGGEHPYILRPVITPVGVTQE
jgi:hypothetical protein